MIAQPLIVPPAQIQPIQPYMQASNGVGTPNLFPQLPPFAPAMVTATPFGTATPAATTAATNPSATTNPFLMM